MNFPNCCIIESKFQLLLLFTDVVIVVYCYDHLLLFLVVMCVVIDYGY